MIRALVKKCCETMADEGGQPIVAEQRRRNLASRDGWDRFAPHRERIMELLIPPAAASDERLCVLGAGNCNDLDLAKLATHFREVHLLDLDGEALDFGIDRQRMRAAAGVHLHAGVDVTGIATDLLGWSPAVSPGDDAVRRTVEKAAAAKPPLFGGEASVVASVCLLTQLLDTVRLAIGESHPRHLDLLMAVRDRHLRMLVEMVRPGGRVVLITDVVSSLTYPQLPNVPGPLLGETITRLIATRNFFTGVNPLVLLRFFRSDRAVASRVVRVELRRPWLWDLGPRVYAVCALVAECGAGARGET